MSRRHDSTWLARSFPLCIHICVVSLPQILQPVPFQAVNQVGVTSLGNMSLTTSQPFFFFFAISSAIIVSEKAAVMF